VPRGLFQPLAGVVVFTMVSRRFANVPSEGIPLPGVCPRRLGSVVVHVSSVTRATLSLVNNSRLVTKVYFPRFLALVAWSSLGSRTSFFSSCSRCSSPSTTSIRRGHRHAAGMAARHGRDRDGHRAVAWNFERKGLSLENLLHCACARTV